MIEFVILISIRYISKCGLIISTPFHELQFALFAASSQFPLPINQIHPKGQTGLFVVATVQVSLYQILTFFNKTRYIGDLPDRTC